MNKETKEFNKKFVDFQKDFNKNWNIGIPTIIIISILIVVLIWFLSNVLTF